MCKQNGKYEHAWAAQNKSDGWHEASVVASQQKYEASFCSYPLMIIRTL